MNGRMKYTIPNAFLGLTGKVNGQLYIAVHGKEDIVTEVEFSFTIKDSIINTIPAVDKLNEIKTFEEWRQRVIAIIEDIQSGYEDMNQLLEEVNSTLTSGLKSINDRNAEVINELNNLLSGSKLVITDLKNNTMSELESKANQIKSDVEKLNKYDTTTWQKLK